MQALCGCMRGRHRREGPSTELEPRLAAVNRALNYFNFTFSKKVYYYYKRRRLNFFDDEITFARKFQYTCQIKIDEISA